MYNGALYDKSGNCFHYIGRINGETLLKRAKNTVSDEFDYMTFRRAILDSHNYIKQMFEGGVCDAKLTDSTANR